MKDKVSVVKDPAAGNDILSWRRQCGCIRTSEKLKKILSSFPPPPPPTPLPHKEEAVNCVKKCHSGGFECVHPGTPMDTPEEKKICSTTTTWQVITEVVQLVQLSVTATALALYYIIYCYMQLVYYTLRSAIYFHNADMPMKITIGVVTATSLVVGFNLLLRMEKIFGVFY